jgi:malate synthase
MKKPDSEPNEKQPETPEQAAMSAELQQMAANIEGQQQEEVKQPQEKAKEKSPEDIFKAAQEEIKRAEEEYENFLAFAEDIKKKFGKRRHQLDPNIPKEKEFIDYWNSEQKRYEDTLKKYGVKPKSLVDRWAGKLGIGPS